MWVTTGAQMAAVDRRAIDAGIAEAALLESAGRETARVAVEVAPPKGPIVVLCGPGNNGGDGLVAARTLSNWGWDVTVGLASPRARLGDVRGRLYDVLHQMGVRCIPLGDDPKGWDLLPAAMDRSALVIDALLGTGSKGEPTGTVRRALELLHAAGRPVLAVDLPSGVDADSGKVASCAVTAVATIAFAAPKPGHLLLPGRAHCGRLVIADIGIPHGFVAAESRMTWMQPDLARRLFPRRRLDAHKGTFGRAVIIAGSALMPGAATLSLRAALRSGAGLVTWAGPASILGIVAGYAAEATFAPLPERDGKLSESAVEAVAAEVQGASAALLGPGLGLGDEPFALVRGVLARIDRPTVVDADALTHLARVGYSPQGASQLVLTPHAGEMARLLGTSVAEVADDRLLAVLRAAQQYEAVVLLKGSPTLIACPSGRLAFSTAGNPVLATGGSGDVLAGLIAGLLAQGVLPFDAAALGAYWHGTAADKMAADGEDAGHTAGDLLVHLPGARARLLAADEEGTGMSGWERSQ